MSKKKGRRAPGSTQQTNDSFSNPLARLGYGTPNLIEATQYVKSGFAADYATMTALYRENWVVKRLIDVVPQDMLKNWYRLETNMSPDVLKRFTRLERNARVREKLLEGMKWGRLYGGAAAVIILEGHEHILDMPLDLDMVMPGSFKGLIVLDRWSGISPGSSIVRDISDPDFGLPEYYDISADGLGYGVRIHHSRILRFTGRPLPRMEEIAEQYWGASEIEHIFSEIKKYDNTSWNIAMLIFSANLKVYKMEGMEQIATMNQRVLSDLYNTMMFMNWMMSNQGLQIIGQNDSFEEHQYSFSGLSDIYESFMMDLAGAAEIPVTKLFGRSPAGMNATGESDLQNYYDSIEEKQESECRPILDRLIPIMLMSEYGAVPDDWDYTFEECRRPTEEEKKNLAINEANAVTAIFNAGIISQKMALRELRNSSKATGMWSGISDEDIDRADDDLGLPGETAPPDITALLGGEKVGQTEGTQLDRTDVSQFPKTADPAD